MYSHEGKRLVSQVLAGKELSVGNTIVLGLNVVYDASIDGSAIPDTHNRYHTPYIVDEIPVANSSVIEQLGGRDLIVFSGQADVAKRYMANNMGLVLVRGGALRTHKTIANVANGINWIGVTNINPQCVFSTDGTLAMTSTAQYTSSISLSGYGASDIVAFPVSFHGGVSPVGATVRLTFTFNNENQVSKTCIYSAIMTSASGKYGFGFETTTHNLQTSFGTDDLPIPFVFQQRLGIGSGWTSNNFQNNLQSITNIKIELVGGLPGLIMRFGSIKVTPDFSADTSRTTTAFRKLNGILRKTDLESYVNPEFVLKGVVV